MKRRTESQARSVLRERLEARRPEIEEAVLTRVSAIADPREVADPAYLEGLRGTVPEAVAFGIESLDSRDGSEPPIPVELLAQARLAARNNVSLDTVLRRYFAGYSLLGYFLIEEAGRDGLIAGAELRSLTATQAARFDRLLAAIGEEHARDLQTQRRSAEQRKAERIHRLLAGEPVDLADIAYGFERWHLGVTAIGSLAEQLIRQLSTSLDCHVLVLPPEGKITSAWIGSRRRLDPADLLRRVAAISDASNYAPVAVAFGEPGEGLSGWRLTSRQAAAALPVARQGPSPFVRYADVALLVSILQDELLATSLHRLYLEPLMKPDRSTTLIKTLRTYFRVERNVSSTAASLGISRQTATKHLNAVEERLGCRLATCSAELEVALRLDSISNRGTAYGWLPERGC